MQAYGDFAEVTGSRWKLVEASGRNYRKKLEVSVESMDVFTASMEAQLFRWKVPSTRTKKNIFMKSRPTVGVQQNFLSSPQELNISPET